MAEHNVTHGTLFSLSRTSVKAGEKIEVGPHPHLVGCYLIKGTDRRTWEKSGIVVDGRPGEFVDGLAEGGFTYEALENTELLCVMSRDNMGMSWIGEVSVYASREGRSYGKALPVVHALVLTDGFMFNGVGPMKQGAIVTIGNNSCGVVAPSGGGALLILTRYDGS